MKKWLNILLAWMLVLGIWTVFLFLHKPAQNSSVHGQEANLVYAVTQDGCSPADIRQLAISFSTIDVSGPCGLWSRFFNQSTSVRLYAYLEHSSFDKKIKWLLYAPIFIHVRCLRL